MLTKFNEAIEDILKSAEVEYDPKDPDKAFEPLSKELEDDVEKVKEEWTEKETALLKQIPNSLLKSDLLIAGKNSKKTDEVDVYKVKDGEGYRYISLAEPERPDKSAMTKIFKSNDDVVKLKKFLKQLGVA